MKTIRLLTAVIMVIVSWGVADAAETLPINQLPIGAVATRNYLVTNSNWIIITAGIVDGAYASTGGSFTITNETQLLDAITFGERGPFNWVESQNPTNRFSVWLWTTDARNNTLLKFYKEFSLVLMNDVWKVPPEAYQTVLANPYLDMPVFVSGITRAVFRLMDAEGNVFDTLDTRNYSRYVEGLPWVETTTQTLFIPNYINGGINGVVTITVNGIDFKYNLNTGKPILLKASIQIGPTGRTIDISGEPGRSVVVQVSNDLQTWTDLVTCPNPNGQCQAQDNRPAPAGPGPNSIFYRLKY